MMIETLILAIASFISTNIDDMLVNTLLLSDASTKSDRRNILFGKYIGIGTLVILSLLGAYGLHLFMQQYIGLLGLIPIGLGIKDFMVGLKQREENDTEAKFETSANKVVRTAFITIANGADNVGVYIPLFAGFHSLQIIITIGVYGILVAVWFFIGKMLANLPIWKKILTDYRSVLIPVVYIALGIYILIKSFL